MIRPSTPCTAPPGPPPTERCTSATPNLSRRFFIHAAPHADPHLLAAFRQVRRQP